MISASLFFSFGDFVLCTASGVGVVASDELAKDRLLVVAFVVHYTVEAYDPRTVLGLDSSGCLVEVSACHQMLSGFALASLCSPHK